MTDKTAIKPSLSTLGIDRMNAAELDELRFETRRRAAWNHRASLLRALQLDPGEEMRVFLQDSINNLERAFQNHAWETAGDRFAKLEPITPLPSAAEVAALADANNAAAQRVAIVANITGWIELAGTFLNIANGRIPALDQADEGVVSSADQAEAVAIPSVDQRAAPPPPQSSIGMIVGALIIGAVIGGLAVAALMKGN